MLWGARERILHEARNLQRTERQWDLFLIYLKNDTESEIFTVLPE